MTQYDPKRRMPSANPTGSRSTQSSRRLGRRTGVSWRASTGSSTKAESPGSTTSSSQHISRFWPLTGLCEEQPAACPNKVIKQHRRKAREILDRLSAISLSYKRPLLRRDER